jgi:putative DNA primase/helicase
MKNNVGPPLDGLAFRLEQRLIGDKQIVAPAIVWESEKVTRTANEILAASDNAAEQRTVRDEAGDWLSELVAIGEVDVKTIRSQAQAAGLSWATVRRAKDRLGIRAERRSEGGEGEGRWVWRLPTDGVQGAQKSQGAHIRNVSTLGQFEHLGPRESVREGQ